jgi:hypothetical protein
MPRITPAEGLARRFCHALAEETAGMMPGSWRMVDTIARRMGIPFEEASTIADDCVRREWVDHRHHTVKLLEEGRQVAAAVRKTIASKRQPAAQAKAARKRRLPKHLPSRRPDTQVVCIPPTGSAESPNCPSKGGGSRVCARARMPRGVAFLQTCDRPRGDWGWRHLSTRIRERRTRRGARAKRISGCKGSAETPTDEGRTTKGPYFLRCIR